MASRFDWKNGVLIDVTTGQPPTAQDHTNGDKANTALMEAESRFEMALRTKYKSRAGDMRYRTNELPPAIRQLALEFQSAYAAWRATWAMADGRITDDYSPMCGSPSGVK